MLAVSPDDGAVVGYIAAEHEGIGRVSFGMGIADGHRSAVLGTQLLAVVIGWAKQRGRTR